jgi:hypothetical protein
MFNHGTQYRAMISIYLEMLGKANDYNNVLPFVYKERIIEEIITKRQKRRITRRYMHRRFAFWLALSLAGGQAVKRRNPLISASQGHMSAPTW